MKSQKGPFALLMEVTATILGEGLQTCQWQITTGNMAPLYGGAV